MCDITTNIQNKLKEKIQSSPKESRNYFSLALNIGLYETIQLLDGREFDKLQLFKYCLELDSNSEYYFEIGQHLKYSQSNETTLNDGRIIKEIDCYLNSISLINHSNNNSNSNNNSKIKNRNNNNNNNNNNNSINNIDDSINNSINSKLKKQINRYYIALADALITTTTTTTNNNNKSIIESNNNSSSKELKLEIKSNENNKLTTTMESFDKTNIILQAIEYCPEKEKEYINYMSNYLDENTTIKLLNGKNIKVKKNLNNIKWSNVLMNIVFIIGIIYNIYYLFFKE